LLLVVRILNLISTVRLVMDLLMKYFGF